MPPQNRNNSFFPSNVKLPAHLMREDTLPNYTNNTSQHSTPTEHIHNQANENISKPNLDHHEHRHTISPVKSVVDNLLSFDIDALLKQNDKLLLLFVAFVLYKEKADWSTIIAVLYLAL